MTLTNITIDNINTTAIHYFPPLCNGTGWNQNGAFTQFAFSQTYTFCQGIYDARAVFKFTGIAVYFISALFQDSNSMWFHLDDRAYEEVQMKSPTGALFSSRVIWSAQNLTNTDHVLELLPGTYDGGYGYVTVDAFM
ncbi:hypothetical protein BDN72DRAFT_212654 [Pluteus cervinus]|uniref:Uncharacterized protein n=1 Tax=Pluteus cervinus TaxID=181527 RepID=A0ACD3B5Z6_9AGAR|nr:hypothetical protein BDN72DRAFT_212654 [Pluteus cervinus]